MPTLYEGITTIVCIMSKVNPPNPDMLIRSNQLYRKTRFDKENTFCGGYFETAL